MSKRIDERWRVEADEVLGRGELAVVCAGVDERTGRQVAVRTLTEAVDPALVERARLRLARLEGLRHASLVEPLAVYEEDGRVVELLERVSGTPVTATSTPLGPQAVIQLGKQVAEGLRALHSRDVVHGDVRPARVLLGARGALLSGCLGLSRSDVVRAGSTAPEVQRGGEPGVPADLYGLGVVLARAMTGDAPFEGPSEWAVLGAQAEARLKLHGPAGLVRLVEQLLDPDPVRRPPDAAAVVRVLDQLAGDPDRPRRLPRRWLAPVRPGSAWMVVGQDPATGQRSLVADGLGRRRAHRLAARLREEGWDVRAARAALGGRQLVLVVAITLAGAVALPGLGAGVGLLLGWYAASVGSQPELARALPRSLAPIPPRQLPAGTESVFAGGMLLLLAALLMWIWPQAVWAPLVALAWVAIAAVRARPRERREPGEARLSALLSRARQAVDGAAVGLDEELALIGEIEDLARLAPDAPDADVLLLRAEDLVVRAEALAQAGSERSTRRVRALRVTSEEVRGAGG